MSFISTGWITHLVIQTSLQCGPALYTVFTQSYKVLNNLTPEYLNVFQYVSQVSSRITRPSVNNLLFVPKAKTEYYSYTN
jgi:hypothetical protein